MRGTHILLINTPNPLALALCTHTLSPPFFSNNPIHPSPLVHAQKKIKDMFLLYQQTLIWYGFAEVGSGYPLSENRCWDTQECLHSSHVLYTYIHIDRTFDRGKHTPHLAGQIDCTLRTRQKEAQWNSNIVSPLCACKHLQDRPLYWFLPLPRWLLLQAHQWHTSSATTQVPTSEWALLGEGHWTGVLREEPDHAGQWGSESNLTHDRIWKAPCL